MKFDILFLDATCHKTYQQDSLENDSLGGTEYATIRLAEGFASKGHKVCVLQRWDRLPSGSTNGVIYAPARWLNMVTARNTIHIRSVEALKETKDSNNILWLHDAAQPFIKEWNDLISLSNAKVVCQSDWHVENVRKAGLLGTINRIYPPLDQVCIDMPKTTLIDSHQLVWMSSPHKGLQEALNTFDKLRAIDPQFKLAVFNPGYLGLALDGSEDKNIRILSEADRNIMRTIVSHSLCLFFPTHFEETFGSVAAECNAMGVPVLHYGTGALRESSDDFKCINEADLIETALTWNKKGRPKRVANPKFSFETVCKEWAKILV